MGTKVRLTQSGGFAGLSMVADVDLDELPTKTAKEVRAALAAMNFQPAPATPTRGGAADTYQYDLVVTEGDERTLTAHEPLADPAMQSLLRVLLPLAKPE
jgi:hypothetical protein